jgi:hypothetical protein
MAYGGWIYNISNPNNLSPIRREAVAALSPPDAEGTGGEGFDTKDDPLRILRKAEAIISRRIGGMMVVIERCTASHNYSAVIRTCEALGVQHLWVINPPKVEDPAESQPSTEEATTKKKKRRFGRKKPDDKSVWIEDQKEEKQHHGYARMATKWVTIRVFDTTTEVCSVSRPCTH